MYIVLEGMVGCGKTTQSKMLVSWLQRRYPNRDVIRTREPWWSQIADDIRKLVQATSYTEDMDPVCEAYLYASSRAQTLRTVVWPALSQGAIVVSDRCFCTSIAYQWVWLGLGFDTIMDINHIAIKWYIPDLVLYMDIDPVVALTRTSDHAWDKHESKPIDFFHAVIDGYHQLATHHMRSNQWHTIDGNRDIDLIHTDICQIVSFAIDYR
jgi:dTMP kinase